MAKHFTQRQEVLLEDLAAELISTGQMIQNNMDQGVRFVKGDFQYRYVMAKRRFGLFKGLLDLKVEGK